MTDDEDVRGVTFEPIAEGDEENCRRLWQGVIVQQYLDALGKFGVGPIQVHARIWLEGREGINSGLYEACFYAGLDFERARKRFSELLKSRSEVIDFRMLKLDKEKNQTPQNRRRFYKRKDKSDELRRRNQRKEVEGFLSRKADNDNFPEYANDNITEDSNGNLINQQEGEE